MSEQDHHPRCAVHLDHALRCTCEREAYFDRKARSFELVNGEHIQWHLPTTKYDVSPCCGAAVGYLDRGRRVCMDEGCDRVYELKEGVPAKYWPAIVKALRAE